MSLWSSQHWAGDQLEALGGLQPPGGRERRKLGEWPPLVGLQPREASAPLCGACWLFSAAPQGCQPAPLSSSYRPAVCVTAPFCSSSVLQSLSSPWVCPCWAFLGDGTRVAPCVWPPRAFTVPPACGSCQCFLPFCVPVTICCVGPACSVCPREALQGLSHPTHRGPPVRCSRISTSGIAPGPGSFPGKVGNVRGDSSDRHNGTSLKTGNARGEPGSVLGGRGRPDPAELSCSHSLPPWPDPDPPSLTPAVS